MKRVLITGGGRRLGRSFALSFAKNGWEVIIHYNKSEQSAIQTKNEIGKMGGQSFCFQSDLNDLENIEKDFGHAFEKFGIPDVLVNNAGVFPRSERISQTSIETLQNAMNVNTFSHFQTSKIFASVAKNDSRIINIASLGGQEIWDGRIAYNVSKSACISMTKALAREMAPNISVNSVSPGMIIFAGEEADDDSGVPLNKIPMKRYGNANDVWDIVWFFANCSSYITGQNINVDGGRHLIV
jgi:pteridine reductase